jgi:hypothetical protein
MNQESATSLSGGVFKKSAISDPTYPHTLDEHIEAARKWLAAPIKHDGKMIKEICARMEEHK